MVAEGSEVPGASPSESITYYVTVQVALSPECGRFDWEALVGMPALREQSSVKNNVHESVYFCMITRIDLNHNGARNFFGTSITS